MGKKKLMTVVDFFRKQCEESGVLVDKLILFDTPITKITLLDRDIYLVVVSRKFRRKDFWTRLEMMRIPVCTTIEKYIVPLDVIAMTPEDLERRGSPIAGYARQGVVVYAA